MKAGEVELVRYLTYHPNEDTYWNSIKIAMRHGYKFDDVPKWFDYIRMLETMDKDLHSPTLIMPEDLTAAHSPSTVMRIIMAHLPSLFTWFRRMMNATLNVFFFIFTLDLVLPFSYFVNGYNVNELNLKMDWTK